MKVFIKFISFLILIILINCDSDLPVETVKSNNEVKEIKNTSIVDSTQLKIEQLSKQIITNRNVEDKLNEFGEMKIKKIRL